MSRKVRTGAACSSRGRLSALDTSVEGWYDHYPGTAEGVTSHASLEVGGVRTQLPVTQEPRIEVFVSVKEESDEVLVRRVLGGDTQAYARLVERYRNRLGRYAVRMLGNEADAEEALQDTFVRGYR